MTNGECIYRKTVDYMSRMALEKDDFLRFSAIWEFRVTEKQVAARVASGWKWAFKIEQFSIDNFDFVIVVHSGKAFFI